MKNMEMNNNQNRGTGVASDPFALLRVYIGFNDYLKENPNRIFRYWVYKHIFTPLEEKQCYSDQSEYESDHARFGVLREVIELPDGDVLMGFAEFTMNVSEILETERVLAYYRLSEIRMNYMPMDEESFDPEGILDRSFSLSKGIKDEAYFRVQRDGTWKSLRFSELTKEEQMEAIKDWDCNALKRMCVLLAACISGKGME